MIVTLTNGRKFVIKNKYDKEYHSTESKDQYGRYIFTEWYERGCTVSITEFTKELPLQKTIVVGKSHCNYKDKFDKDIAKSMAYFRAIEQARKSGMININEADELEQFDLDACSFTCEKVN